MQVSGYDATALTCAISVERNVDAKRPWFGATAARRPLEQSAEEKVPSRISAVKRLAPFKLTFGLLS